MHTITSHTDAYSSSRTDLEGLGKRIDPEMPAAELPTIVGAALKALGVYNHGLQEGFRQQAKELHAVISSLTGAVAGMVAASDSSLQQLDQIRAELAQAVDPRDLQASKKRLDACLRQIAEEIRHHQEQSASGLATITALSDGLDDRLAHTSRRRADSTSALRLRAEEVLANVAGGSVPSVAVVCALNRLKQIKLRFGQQACDELIEHCSTYLSSGLNPEAGLFRWNDVAFVAILQRAEPFIRIRRDVQRLHTCQQVVEISFSGRTVLMPNSIAWTMFPAVRPVDGLVQQIDAFIEGQTREDAYVAG